MGRYNPVLNRSEKINEKQQDPMQWKLKKLKTAL
jgi:hypothetical protein